MGKRLFPHQIRLTASFAILAMLVSFATFGSSAGAQSVESLRDRASKAAAELTDLQKQSDVLNEKYLQTQDQIEGLKVEQVSNKAEVDKARAQLDKTRKEASSYLVEAYVGAGTRDGVVVDSSNANEALNQKVLLSLLKNDRVQVADTLESARTDLEDKSAALDRSESDLEARRSEQSAIVSQLEASVDKQQSLLSSANTELNDAIRAEQARVAAQAEARAQAEAERAAQQAAARQAAAAQAVAAQTAAAQTAATQSVARSQATSSTSAPSRSQRRAAPSRSQRRAAPARNAAPAPNRTPAPAPAFTPPAVPASAPSSGAAGAIAAAKSRLGTPYRWGGVTPAGFDCSGLMLWAWRQVGVSLPRTSGAQRAATQRISRDQLQPGDLVFSGNPVYHVGMYIGGGQMIHSPHTGDVTKISPLRGGATYGRIG